MIILIIEFTGIPGSGKTTLCKTLLQYFIARNYQVWTQTDYWRQIGNKQLSFSGRMFFFFRKLIICLKSSFANSNLIFHLPWLDLLAGQSFKNKWRCLNSFLTNLAEYEAAKNLESHNTIALMDEGIFHRAYNIFVMPEKCLNNRRLLLYGKAVNMPDLLIYLKAPVSVCFGRISRRGLPIRMQGLNHSIALEMMLNGEKALNSLIEDLKQRKLKTVKVIEIECQDLSEANRKLLNCIEKLLFVG